TPERSELPQLYRARSRERPVAAPRSRSDLIHQIYRYSGATVEIMTDPAQPYDALLLCSFGGPNGPDDVIPFLKNVTRGKGIPEARLAEVGEHYFRFGGRSPINEQNLELVDALRAELDARGS